MTTHEALAQIRFFAHKYAKWGDVRIKADVGGTYHNILAAGYQSSPTPHILFGLHDATTGVLTVSGVTHSLALYEDKSYPVFLKLSDDDVREITSVAVDSPQKLILLQTA